MVSVASLRSIMDTGNTEWKTNMNTAAKPTEKVCMVVHEHFPRDFRVRREARALVKAGLEVTIISLKEPGQPFYEYWMGFEIIRLPVKRHRGSPLAVYMAEYLSFAWMAAYLVALLHSVRRFRVVHVHTPPDFLVMAGWFTKIVGSRLVLDIHDLTPELYASRFGSRGGKVVQRLYEMVELGSCKYADKVVTTTDAFRDRLIARGVAAEKIMVVSNYPDPDLFGIGLRPRIKRKKKDHFIIMHHGTMLHRYGQDILLEAFEKVLEIVPNARLELYGRGDLLPKLEQWVLERKLFDKIRFFGEVPQEEIVKALEQADLCVVPNRTDAIMELAFPTKLLEAIHMGCPVVASATRLVADTFDPGTVRLVEPGDPHALYEALVDLATNPGTRSRLARQAKKTAERFSWEREQNKLVDLYAELGCRIGGDAL